MDFCLYTFSSLKKKTTKKQKHQPALNEGETMIPRSCSPSLGPQFVFEAQETSETDTLEVGVVGLSWAGVLKGSIAATPASSKMVNVHCPSPQ